CPPNTVRTVAEAVNYAYSLSAEGVWFNLYGGSELETSLAGGKVKLSQTTAYPWQGTINVKVEEAPSSAVGFFFRIPGWCTSATLSVNGTRIQTDLDPGTYARLDRTWHAGDEVILELDMPVTAMESHPFLEETRNQIAVKRGPIVYCMEAADLPADVNLFDLAIPVDGTFEPVETTIRGTPVTA